MSDSNEAHKAVNSVSPSFQPSGQPQRVYLITGGTGTLGTALTKHLLSAGHKVRVLARNEHGHEKLEAQIPPEQRARLSPIMADVEQADDLLTAFRGVDYVIHAAAAKIIPKGEYNPKKFYKTNVQGSSNVVDACIDAGVKRAVLVSTDKASAPCTHYGKTKAAAESLWLNANRLTGGDIPYFCAVRYGNVFASAGSVLHVWEKKTTAGEAIELTDPQCTRFHITLSQAVSFVLSALRDANPGELWVPRLPSYRLGDFAHAYRLARRITQQPITVGLRLSEKLHESMISTDESSSLKAEEDLHYTLEPGVIHRKSGFSYNSGSNEWKLGVEALKEEIKTWANI